MDQNDLIEAAVTTGRDPFREPQPVRTGSATGNRPVTQTLQEIPTCNGLLFDNVSPAVELTWSGGSSGWLHTGDEFLGWRIVKITPQTVTIVKGSESRVLHSP